MLTVARINRHGSLVVRRATGAAVLVSGSSNRRYSWDNRAWWKTSPYNTEVRIAGGGGRIPLRGGYFEVPLPAKLFEGNPLEITLRWIDFYRN